MRYAICFLIVFTAATAAFPASSNVVSTSPVKTSQAKVQAPGTRAQEYFSQGYLYYLEKSYTEAIPEFVKALRFQPNMVKARYWMAKTYYELGRYKNTVNQCSAALAVAPRYKSARSLMLRAQKRLDARTSSRARTYRTRRRTAARTAAIRPAAISSAAKTPETRSEARTVIRDSQRPISLDLRNVDISSVLQILSRETGLSIIAGSDVYGKVTAILNNVPPQQALDIILKSNGYTYARQGDVVQVFSSSEPARVEELPGGVFVRTFIINYVGPDELLATLTKLMPEDASIYTTKGSKTVVIKGTADDLKRAEVLIRNLDIPPRQVMVEAKIIEVDLNETSALGINNAWTNPNNATQTLQTVGLANPPTGTGATGLFYSITDQNITTLVEALSTRTGFNILSSPKVMALNEQKAEILTGSELGYYVNTVTTTGLVQNVEFMDVGTKLDITPSVKSDGMIIMDIHPEISDGSIVNNLPQKNSTETTTQLIVKDGQTIVIGGLIRDTQQKEVKGVPVLMDVPFFGELLKRTDYTSEKKEIIVLMTPHIMNSKYIEEMEGNITDMERQRKDLTPSMPLDLVR
jgi:type IV pilus secretin PilQ/predicted competence protein